MEKGIIDGMKNEGSSLFFYSIILVCSINLSQRTLDLGYKF